MKNDVSLWKHIEELRYSENYIKKIQRKSFCARLLCSCNGGNSTV